MEKLSNAIENFIEANKGYTVGFAIATVFIIGFCFIYPSQRTKEFAKDHILHLIIGIAVVMCCVAIAKGFYDSFQ